MLTLRRINGQQVQMRLVRQLWSDALSSAVVDNTAEIALIVPTCPWSVAFLKFIIEIVEGLDGEADGLYDALTNIIALPAPSTVERRYHLS